MDPKPHYVDAPLHHARTKMLLYCGMLLEGRDGNDEHWHISYNYWSVFFLPNTIWLCYPSHIWRVKTILAAEHCRALFCFGQCSVATDGPGFNDSDLLNKGREEKQRTW